MAFSPHSYQTKAVGFMLRRLFVEGRQGAGLFLDPGLGKTAITLRVLEVLKHLGEVRRALVIAPLRVIHNVWPTEIQKWGFDLTCSIVHGTPKQRERALCESADIYLINPEATPWLLSRLSTMSYDVLVVDESTKFKAWSAKRSKSLRKLIPTCQRRIILTGTPAPNSMMDLHAQAYILDDGAALGKSATIFRNRYCERGGFKGREWRFRDDRREELERAISDMVLRMAAEDYLDMPPLVINDIWVDLPPTVQRDYKRLERELFLALGQGEGIFATSAGAKYAMCRGAANGGVYQTHDDGMRESMYVHDAKLDALGDLIEELRGKPLLVGYLYNHDLERMLERFGDTPVIRGGTPTRRCKDVLVKWNEGNIPLLFAQPQAMSHGLNMQGASADIACIGLPDSWEVLDQFIRRVYRQGVTSQVRVHRILAKDTVDVAVRERVERKESDQSGLLAALGRYQRGEI